MASGRAADFLREALRGREPHPRPPHDLRGEPRAPRQDAVVERPRRRDRRAAATSPRTSSSSTSFEPEVVISDFESWTYLYAQDAPPADPLDRQHADHQPLHAPAGDHRGPPGRVPAHARRSSRASCRSATHYFITTFFRPPSPQGADARCSRRSCGPRSSPRSRGAASTCSSTRRARATTALAETLAQTGLECRIYGMRREHHRGAGRGQPPLPARSARQASSTTSPRARAVIAGGGFTLMGEAVYLHKPMLAVPLGAPVRAGAQRALPRARGLRPRRRTLDAAVIARFVDAVPPLRGEARGVRAGRQSGAFAELDALLDRASAGVL